MVRKIDIRGNSLLFSAGQVRVDYAPCDRTPSAASRASRATCQYECQRGMSESGAAGSSGSNPMARVITRATVSTSPFVSVGHVFIPSPVGSASRHSFRAPVLELFRALIYPVLGRDVMAQGWNLKFTRPNPKGGADLQGLIVVHVADQYDAFMSQTSTTLSYWLPAKCRTPFSRSTQRHL